MRYQIKHDPELLRAQYESATPFPHAVLDGLFAEAELKNVLSVFPGPDDAIWRRFDNAREKKLGFFHEMTDLPDEIWRFLCFMNSFRMIEFLEKLTGIEGLVSDPYYGGGGLHQIERGGFLKVHADFNWHPKLRLDRRLNVLVYLNEDWPDEYGGHLELLSRDGARCVERILPIFNRTVVFSTTDDSYHGHPQPLACPADRTRKSISLYYYTNGRPEETKSAPHDTLFIET